MKPRIFIGSSVEALKLAQAIQAEFEYFAYPELWNQNTFRLTNYALEDLQRKVNEIDYGIFVFAPDDVVNIRGEQQPVPRDNLFLEFGLFLGRLGRGRLFFIKPRDVNLRLPTDLLGANPATYDSDRIRRLGQRVTVRQLRPVVSAACLEIQDDIRGREDTNVLFRKLSRRLVYLLRHMQDDDQVRVGSYYWRALAIYRDDQNRTKESWLPEEIAGWKKASEFACFYLYTLDLVEQPSLPSPGFIISEAGKRLLDSEEVEEAFRVVFDKPLVDNDRELELLRRAGPEGEPDGVDAVLSNLSEHQRAHLVNLAQGTTENYEGQSSLRAELRRLRDMGFVRTLPDRSIEGMGDGVNFDLSDYVVLTDLGALLVARIR